MQARDIMTADHIWTCNEATEVREAAQMLAEHNIGSLPVLDNQGRLSGLITDRDICCRVVAHGRGFETPVRDVMSKPVHMVHPDADVREVERVMEEYKIRRIPVVDEDNRLQGYIAIADLATKARGLLKSRSFTEVLEVISTP